MSSRELPYVPLPSFAPYSLSEQINAATRVTHSQLNRLILARLPLALPPFTTNSSTYVSGLLHIAPIYIEFESLWQSILDATHRATNLEQTLQSDTCDPEQPLLDSRSAPVTSNIDSPSHVHEPNICSRTRSLLCHLQLPGLLRAGRLRADIRVLTCTPEHKIQEQIEAVSKSGRLAEFLSHTKASVEANPHVLLAYAWVFYMALFSGGRHLRATLREAGGLGAKFWDRDPSPVLPYFITRDFPLRQESRPASPAYDALRASARSRTASDSVVSKKNYGLQFFSFIGDQDGEDLKIEFKKRMSEAEILLTKSEKEDIVSEAQIIFKFMVEIVKELDVIMETKEEDFEDTRFIRAMRDSVSLAKERLLGKTTLYADQPQKKIPSKCTATNAPAKLVHFGTSEVALSNSAVQLSERLLKGTPFDKGSCSEMKSKSLMYSDRMVGFSGFLSVLPIIALGVGFFAWCWVKTGGNDALISHKPG